MSSIRYFDCMVIHVDLIRECVFVKSSNQINFIVLESSFINILGKIKHECEETA